MSLFDYLRATWIGGVMRDVPWSWPVAETMHYIGLSLLFGAFLIFDIRMMGFLKGISMRSALNFTRIAMVGFGINVVTGFAFFCAFPDKYWENPAFKLKMLMVVLVLLNVLFFEFVERRKVIALGPGAEVPTGTKISAVVSIVLWTGILLAGRMLPTFGTIG
jgi:hypothetical protein